MNKSSNFIVESVRSTKSTSVSSMLVDPVAKNIRSEQAFTLTWFCLCVNLVLNTQSVISR